MKTIYSLLALSFFISCSVDDGYTGPTESEAEAFARNQEEIEAYLEANDLTATTTDSGLTYILTEEGTGDFPTTSSTVTVAYKGYFLNGNIFDQSAESTFNLGQVIPGFQEGITYLKPGGKITLFVPARLGYGAFGNSRIPPNTALIFDVELISFE